MTQHILVVEDEIKIAQILQDYLEKSGFKVSCLDNGNQVLQFVKDIQPDLILLDVMLPDSDGMEICGEIRENFDVPVIMVTARADEEDRILGFGLGADDYIGKPFSPREVVARVKSVLKRVHPEKKNNQISNGPIILDQDSRQVKIGNHVLNLTRSEYSLLFILITRPNRVFSRSELLAKVQGYDFEGYERTIDSHIKNLRKKLESLLPDKEIITAVYGMGYKLNKII